MKKLNEEEMFKYLKTGEITEVETSEDIYFHPLICCVSCANVTKDWEWVENPDDGKIYGVCDKCKEQVKQKGLKMYKSPGYREHKLSPHLFYED